MTTIATRRAALALALTAGLMGTALAGESEKDKPGTIHMLGTGEVRFAPDMATITLGTVSQAKTARDALAANTKAMTEAVNTLKSAGIEPKDLQTSNFSVSPQYTTYSSGSVSRPPVITGYQVNNTLTVRVRDLTKLGDILDKAVSVGANSVHGPVFGITDMEKARENARKAAVENALGKAKLYAAGLGVSLGRVLRVEEQGMAVPRPAPMMMRAAVAEAASAPAPIEAGESSLTSNVSVTWEIAR